MKHIQEGAVKLPTEVRKGQDRQPVLTIGFPEARFDFVPQLATFFFTPKEHKKGLAILHLSPISHIFLLFKASFLVFTERCPAGHRRSRKQACSLSAPANRVSDAN